MIKDDNEESTLPETVAVPQSQITLIPEQQQTLQQSINPLVDSRGETILQYIDILQYIYYSNTIQYGFKEISIIYCTLQYYCDILQYIAMSIVLML